LHVIVDVLRADQSVQLPAHAIGVPSGDDRRRARMAGAGSDRKHIVPARRVNRRDPRPWRRLLLIHARAKLLKTRRIGRHARTMSSNPAKTITKQSSPSLATTTRELPADDSRRFVSHRSGPRAALVLSEAIF